jgi:hypothetical protein
MPDEFWKLTPFEFQAILNNHINKTKIKHNDIKSIAWMIAMLSRAKDIPKLEDLLKEDKPKEPQTADQMMAMVKILNAAYGGDEIEVS